MAGLPETETRKLLGSITRSPTSIVRIVGEGLARADATQVGAHPREQLLGRERLGDVVVGAGIEAAHLVAVGVERGHHDDRHLLAAGPQGLGDLIAVHARQHEVEQHEVGVELVGRLERRCPVAYRVRGEAGTLERVLDGLADDRVVFDHEDRRHACVSLGSGAWRAHHCTPRA